MSKQIQASKKMNQAIRKPGSKSTDKKKEKVWVPKKIAREVDQDIRVKTDPYKDVALPNEMNAVNFFATISEETLYGIGQAYISVACSRGLLLRSSSPDVPAFAAYFTYQVLYSYATASVPPCPKVPLWLRKLGGALTPTIVPMQMGQASYKFNVIPQAQPPGARIIGEPGYGNMWNPVGVNSGVLVNLFPLSTGTASAYTNELGAAAFQDVIQFMAEVDDDKRSNLVDFQCDTKFTKDVSAFSVVGDQQGRGSGGVGGVAALAQLEVPIFHPLLARFVSGFFDNETLTRNYNVSGMVAGDTLFLGGAISSWYTGGEWRARRPPRFHPIWFEEFVDVLGEWVSGVLQVFSNESKQTADPNVALQCPLTFQEFQILLRATLMSAFSQTQPLVQALYPSAPSNASDEQFVPLVSGANTCALEDPGMLLPVPFIENIRTLVGRKFQVGKRAHDILAYIPILGSYANTTMDGAVYTYVNANENDVPVFSVSTGITETQNVKGKEIQVPLVETPISMIDGTSTGSGGGYVFINDPRRLKELALVWNGFLMGSGISSNSCPLGTLGTEQGLKALASGAMTRYLFKGAGPNIRQHPRDPRVAHVSSSQPVFNEYRYPATSSQGPILAPAFQQVQSLWILPTLKMNHSSPDASSYAQRWQAIVGEPYLAPESSENTGIGLGEVHALYAAKMVRGRLAPPTDWDVFFEEAEKKGRGGILSGIGGALDSIFGF